ncbi:MULTISPECIES: sulfatase-like hydrolase/transferase [unclassified Yoonia]|uniref:sulfatase-like hydrolase/transferase n=1 Tax=unclassified Yoonia TaxID=2629118 RepID=UPI002AFE566A|nr:MULTISPECIES: sulfatase-like hydrolase/transferase [unclassified Yoonia]
MNLVLRLFGVVLAAALLHLALIQPNHPNAMTWGALRLFPLELPVILLALLALSGRALVFRALLVGVLSLIVILKIADYANFVAYNRVFNPATDMGLIRAAYELGTGALGPVLGNLVAVGAALMPFALAGALWWATGRWVRLQPPAGWALVWRGGFGVLAVLAAGVMVGQIGAAKGQWALPVKPPGAAFSARLAYDRVGLYRATQAELAAFVAAAESDPFAAASPLFDRLAGRDVVFIFIESYGRASFDNPLYIPTHSATLRAAQDDLAQIEAIAMRSGWMTAPITGGQSWLAHTSIASGLWISDQIRYRALLASPRKTLFQLATQAGYHTATVVPAITRDWPEGPRIGFETILAKDDLGYQGLPFNWVTMPDQFTLTAYDRLLAKAPRDGRPLFAEISLISSHAPWVPVPELIDWDDVGDGTVFNEIAQSDDPPNVVWRDHDRVRDQYRRAIDYALQVSFSYVARQGADMPLFIVLGDHQAAGFVAQGPSLDVPVHVIGPTEVVAMIDQWGWTPGLLPDETLPAWSMDLFRDRFLRAYSTGVP